MQDKPKFLTSVDAVESGGDFAVHVVFTSPASTFAALKTAAGLARSLGAHIRILATQVVPYPTPLEDPPVAAEFTERRLRRLARAAGAGSTIRVYLCRDPRQTLEAALEPESLLVIGGKKRWWPTAEQRLARWLEAKGHRVIFAARRCE